MESLGLFEELLVLFAAAALVAWVCHFLRAPAMLGFLAVGIVAGPSALGVVSEGEAVELIAEIGVALLLFSIGIEFSLEKLYHIRWNMVAGGGLQMLITAGLFSLGLWAFFSVPPRTAALLGLLVGLSSTAIALKLFSMDDELDAPQGRLGLGILLFQDLLVLPIMVVTPILAEGAGSAAPGSPIWAQILKAGLFIFCAALGGRTFFPWILEQAARTRSRELFLLVTIVLCLGTAWLGQLAGFSLSLGAFVAGLLLSQSEFSHQALGELIPFREVSACLFLISVGMLLDLQQVAAAPWTIAGLVVGTMAFKTAAAALACVCLGYTVSVSLRVGLALAQIGEFSFVVAMTDASRRLLGQEYYPLFLAGAVATMILSPLPKLAGPRLLSWMGRLPPGKPRREGVQGAGPAGAVERVRDHAIILGYGPVGRWIARALRKLEMPYAVVELNPRTVREERRAGEAIVFGDASRPDILELVGVATAKLAVITIPDPAAARAATQLVRRLSPQIHVIVRVRFLREIQIFLDLGANEVVADEHQVRREVFARSLAAMGVTRTKIHELGGEVLA